MHLNLKKDAEKAKEYLQKRIADYSPDENHGPGQSGDPIKLITVGYYAEQGGNLHLVFDTRPEAQVDGEWTIYIEDTNTLDFSDWCDWYEEVAMGRPGTATLHDGTTTTLKFDLDDEEELLEEEQLAELNAVFGEMLKSVVDQLKGEKWFQKLPLAPDAFLVIEEFDGHYFWPEVDYEQIAEAARLN